VFHEFQPMGGVRARGDGIRGSCVC